jgi:hypothetical protein
MSMPRLHDKGDRSRDVSRGPFHPYGGRRGRGVLLAGTLAVASATLSIVSKPAESASAVAVAAALCVARTSTLSAACAPNTGSGFAAGSTRPSAVTAIATQLAGCRTSPHCRHRRLEQP